MTPGSEGRQRPIWWPEDEPWPPQGRPPFVRRFFRRIAIAALVFFAIAITLSFISAFLWSGDRRGGPPPFVPFLLVVVLLLFVARRVTSRFARPLGNVLETIDRLAAGDYSARAEEVGPSEMQALGRAVNSMAARLESGEEERRNLVADIAHEVRTPLAVIRGNIEGMLDGVYAADSARLAPVLEEVEVIGRLVDDLQTLSSAEAGMLRLHTEPIELAGLVQDVADSFAAQAEAAGVTLSVRDATSPVVTIDPPRIRQVLENLLSNALRHTPEGGAITIALDREGANIAVRVTDTGSGIDPDVLPYIFERYRKAPDSTGSGLGLAIARRLVEAHNG
ncbi:MAG: ATP-binding protein, partial [Dehalococcoidia bacterium]|nr:ATP-binding protein [Dehalococcoidia bacterium]